MTSHSAMYIQYLETQSPIHSRLLNEDCIVLYLYIYIAPLTAHTNQRRFQCQKPRIREWPWKNEKALGSPVNIKNSMSQRSWFQHSGPVIDQRWTDLERVALISLSNKHIKQWTLEYNVNLKNFSPPTKETWGRPPCSPVLEMPSTASIGNSGHMGHEENE